MLLLSKRRVAKDQEMYVKISEVNTFAEIPQKSVPTSTLYVCTETSKLQSSQMAQREQMFHRKFSGQVSHIMLLMCVYLFNKHYMLY